VTLLLLLACDHLTEAERWAAVEAGCDGAQAAAAARGDADGTTCTWALQAGDDTPPSTFVSTCEASGVPREACEVEGVWAWSACYEEAYLDAWCAHGCGMPC